MPFLLIQLLNELFYSFQLKYNLLPFFIITFSIPNSFWFTFCNSFLFFFIKIINNICLRHSIFNFFNQKPLQANLECTLLHKYFYILIFTNFKFRTFIIDFSTRFKICDLSYMHRFYFNCGIICIAIFMIYII